MRNSAHDGAATCLTRCGRVIQLTGFIGAVKLAAIRPSAPLVYTLSIARVTATKTVLAWCLCENRLPQVAPACGDRTR